MIEEFVKVSEYIVYVARFDDVLMYVGEGKVGRDNHLNSGLSHVYQANRHHFAGLKLEIEVVATVSTKEGARLAEKRFIAEHCPIWNKIDTTFDAVRARKEYRRILERLIDDKKITHVGQIEVMQYKNCYQDIEGVWCYDYCDGVGCYEYLQYRFDLQHDYMSATWVEPTLEELLIWGSTVEW